MSENREKKCKRCGKKNTWTPKEEYMCCNQDCPSISGGAE